jgi:hypothetical protein
MPTSFPLTLSDSDLISSARLRLGLPAGPANAPAPPVRLWDHRPPGRLQSPSHLHLPRPAADVAPRLCHDFVTTSWRRIAARAGVHTKAEPPFCFFLAPSPTAAFPSAGPELAFSSGGCASGLPVPVPDAPALAPAAASALPADPAPSPGPGASSRSLDPRGVPPSPRTQGMGGCHVRSNMYVSALPFVPMSVESFGRLGAPALTLLGDLAVYVSVQICNFMDVNSSIHRERRKKRSASRKQS